MPYNTQPISLCLDHVKSCTKVETIRGTSTGYESTSLLVASLQPLVAILKGLVLLVVSSLSPPNGKCEAEMFIF